MFNWATEKLEKLSQTVAPPPDDPTSRYVYFVQKNDEAGAQGCLAEIDPLHTIVQSNKGTTPLHLACGHSMVNLIRQIMSIPGASVEVTDTAGNTPLHHASMSTDLGNGVNVVRMLITEYNASVVAKNWQGQTPYDVATLDSIRQYLLPLQLQQETQQAIDNGGVGLPPGTDMGGLRISQPAMPPPPIGGMGAPPTPPSAPPNMLATPSPNMPHTAPPAAAQPPVPQPANMSHTVPSASQPPVPAASTFGNGPRGRSASGSSAPSSDSSAHRTYSRSGSSSAAVLSKAKFRPDGFHSSSSDVTLQKKYGHSSHGPPAAAVPPPPSSGNSAGPPPGGASSSSNPYAAGSSAFGSANRYGGAAARYPVYGAVAGQPNVVAPPSSGGYSGVPQPAVAPSYAVFQPGAQTQQQQPAVQQLVPPEAQQQAPAAQFMSPPPYQNQSQPQQPAYPQQPMTQQPQQMNGFQEPSAQQQFPQQQPMQQAPAPMAVSSQQQQPYAGTAQPPLPGPYPMTNTLSAGNVSTASADEVFASPSLSVKKEETDAAPAVPAAKPAARTVTSDSARSSVSSAQEHFATSAGEANGDSGVQQQPTETNEPNGDAATQGAGSSGVKDIAAPSGEPSGNAAESTKQTDTAVPANDAGTAADLFGPNGAASTSAGPPVEKGKEERGESAVEESTDGLDDVPLEEVPLTPSEGSADGPSAGHAAAFPSVGLPPPPFSRQ